MEIALDARLLAYQSGGISSYIRGLLVGFRGLGLRRLPRLLLSRRMPPDPEVAAFPVVRCLTPPHHRWEQALLAAEIWPRRIALLHSPDFIPLFTRRWRSVITVHDLAFLRFPEFLTPESRRYYGQIGRAVAAADAIIAVSECTRRDLLTLVDAPAEKITVIPEAPAPAFRPGPGPATDRPYFLFVGVLEPRKNIPGLLRAYARLWQTVGEACPDLVLAGRPGWLCAEVVAQLTDPGWRGRVRWLAAPDQPAIVQLMQGALALVLPSYYEGFGLPVLEAMACGTPVIASNRGALPEVAGDAALLVDPDQPEALAQAMRQLWEDPALRRDLGRRGLQRAAAFSWTATARATLAVYARVLGDASPYSDA